MHTDIRSKKGRLLCHLALSSGALLAAAIGSSAWASSHREAPFITEQPKVDGTDLYMFRSYEPGRSAYTTLIANYIPFQDPFGGPNYYMFDPEALYQIHIDNNGDARPDISFEFRFQNTNKNTTLPVGGKNVPIPLIQSGQITTVNPPTLNVRETYTIGVSRNGRRAVDITNASGGSATFDKPVDNIGNKTLPNYPAYAAQHLYTVNIPGCSLPARVFVGQRKESFVINVGEIFDLINIPPEVITGQENARRSDLEDKNISTIALEVPTECLKGNDPIIGGWTTASLPQTRVLRGARGAGERDDDGDRGRGRDSALALSNATRESGPFVQVSRLGMPLVNEVVIGLKDKDRFNASEPENDAQFLEYVTNPTLPELVEILFGAQGVRAPNNFPRNDLVTAFLTGVPGLNKPAGVRPSEMMRLNTSIAPRAKGAQERLGVLAGDTAGFPNGRRPGDDVVDIELRVAMGVLCTLNQPAVFGCVPADAPSGSIPFTDGAFTSDARFDAVFPYLTTPIPGSPQALRRALGGEAP